MQVPARPVVGLKFARAHPRSLNPYLRTVNYQDMRRLLAVPFLLSGSLWLLYLLGYRADRVLTIRRIGYVLVIQTYLHDLGGILEYLRACDLIQETPTTEQFAHIHDGQVAECLESCAGFSKDRSRRVVFGFTNPRPSLENRVLENFRSSFADQLQQTCERRQEIKRILIRRLAG
jgi:hypothetical protein